MFKERMWGRGRLARAKEGLYDLSDINAIMSDMSSDRITVRVPQALTTRLRNRSRAKGTTESEVVREALESYLGHSRKERSDRKSVV
jgi:hypothetical protein